MLFFLFAASQIFTSFHATTILSAHIRDDHHGRTHSFQTVCGYLRVAEEGSPAPDDEEAVLDESGARVRAEGG